MGRAILQVPVVTQTETEDGTFESIKYRSDATVAATVLDALGNNARMSDGWVVSPDRTDEQIQTVIYAVDVDAANEAAMAIHRPRKTAEINAHTTAIITAGAILKGQEFGTSIEDQGNFTRAATALLVRLIVDAMAEIIVATQASGPAITAISMLASMVPASVSIKPKGNTEPVAFTVADLPELLQVMELHISVPLESGRLLKVAIEAAETIEDLEAIVDDRALQPFDLASFLSSQ